MKTTIAAILITAAGLAIAVVRSGHGSWGDLAILGVAVVSVCVFGALPVVIGNRRKAGMTQDRVVLPGRESGPTGATHPGASPGATDR